MRRMLDAIYLVSGLISAGLIAAICLLVTTQVVFNLITKSGFFDVNLTIPSYADFAGYMLAASTFLALAYTLTRGGHIRVGILLNVLPRPARLAAEMVSLLVGAGVAGLATYYMYELTSESHEFGDMSSGIIAIPLYIPQLAVLAGLAILTLALVDLAVRVVLSGDLVIEDTGLE